MKFICVVSLFVACLAQHCHAQMSVNSWSQGHGITVRSSQEVVVPATKIRCFTTIKSQAADLAAAMKDLEAKKKSIADAIDAAGLSKNTLKFSEPKIPYWKQLSKKSGGFGGGRELKEVLLDELDDEEYETEMHCTFDVSIEAEDGKNTILSIYEKCRRLNKQAAFESLEVEVLFVGEVDAAQIAKAKKMAFDEAHEEAKSLSALAGKPLGKMANISLEVSGRWGSSYRLSYGFWNHDEPTALEHFSPGENEVFGTDPSDLSREFKVSLSFNIE